MVAVDPPGVIEVVPAAIAGPVLHEVRTALTALEQELREALQEAEDAERDAGMTCGTTSTSDVADRLLHLAEELRAEAEEYADRVLSEARGRAAALLDGERPAPRLRLAPQVDPD